MFNRIVLLALLFFVAGYSFQDVVLTNTTSNSTSLEKRSNGALVHYYWDGGCKNFANELHVTADSTNRCLQYYIAGAWSMNVAGCYGDKCYCYFYYDDNCKNPYKASSYPYYDCINDKGAAIRSLSCGNTR